MLPMRKYRLVLEIKINEIFYENEPHQVATSNHNHNPSVDFSLEEFSSESNSLFYPWHVDRCPTIFSFNPQDKEKLQKVQSNLVRFFKLDDATILQVVRKLEAYIALNPQQRRLQVTIIQVAMFLDEETDAREWLVELGNIPACRSIRVEDLDCEDGAEYSCPICPENMAKKQKDLPVRCWPWGWRWRWPWDPQPRTVTCMPCNHVFHNACIAAWLFRSSFCPVCRLDVDKPKAFD